ncbi:MAG: RNA polymerase sigma factor [Gemmatimonadales bacterium]
MDRQGEERAFGREQRSEQSFAGRSEQRSPGDAEVVEAVLDGRHDQYGILVRRYQDVLFRYAERMTGRADEAEDIVQLTFVRGYRSLASCRDPDRVGGWLFRIAANLCKDQVKGRRRREQPLDEYRELRVDEPGPLAVAEQDEIRRRIDEALERLHADQREAFVLKHIEGWSYQEMSEQLEVSVPALKMRVHRAREELQRLLESYYAQ